MKRRDLVLQLQRQGLSSAEAVAVMVEQHGITPMNARTFNRQYRIKDKLTPETPREYASRLFAEGDRGGYFQCCEAILRNVEEQGFVSAEQIQFLNNDAWINWIYTPGNVTAAMRRAYPRMLKRVS